MLLEVKHVSKSYEQFRALDDVSISVGEREIVAIIGPNGAGKTTLVNVVTGLLGPSAGQVLFKGRDIAGAGPVALAKLGMARAFQLVQVFPALTVRETLSVASISRLGRRRMFSRLLVDAEIDKAGEEIASIFKLAGRLDAKASELSQGEKKLLDVASAFALNPEVILLDEPTSGVSTSDKYAVMEVLLTAAKLKGIKSIILVEHDMELVSRYSTRIVALQEGRVLADLPPRKFFANSDLVSLVAGRLPRSQGPGRNNAVH